MRFTVTHVSLCNRWAMKLVCSQPKTLFSLIASQVKEANREGSQTSVPSAVKWLSLNTRQLSSEGKQLPVLTLYTKDPCPLCDDALAELQPYRHRFSLEKVDITLEENRKWYKEYRFDIPVFHFNGTFLMKHRVNHDKLLSELSNWEQSNK